MTAIRRILVALDASPHSRVAVEIAAELASRIEAELMGLFVEDVDLLRLANAPYAREILYASALESSLTSSSMESELKAQSEMARNALQTAAQRAQVRWSFRTVRGHVTEEILSAAGEADLLAIGKAGWSFTRRPRIGSTAMELTTTAIPLLLLPDRDVPGSMKLLVYYDGTPAAKRGLLAAAQFAVPGSSGITVLIDGAHPELAESAQVETSALVQGKGIPVSYRPVDSRDESSLLRAVSEEQPGIFVLGSRTLLKKLSFLETFLRDAEIPLLLAGHGSETEAD